MMKTNSKLFSAYAVCMTLICGSCTEETPLQYQNDPAVYFGGDSLSVSFTEVEGDEYIFQVPVITQGDTSGIARQVILAQDFTQALPDGYDRAESGVHFQPLEQPDAPYVIPAGKATVKLPVKVFRTPDMLEGKSYVLDLQLLANDNFRQGMKNKLHFRIKFSGLPEKPSNWDSFWGLNLFGMSWGPVKHNFITVHCGKIDWSIGSSIDIALGFYYQSKVKKALADYNSEHPDAPLCEKNGTRVSFDY
jgi:hypothetical protein